MSHRILICTLKASPGLTPCAFSCEIDGKPAFAIGDLLAPHPSLPDVWKITGRKDDQIMHSNGEKTNPGPMGNIFLYPLLFRNSVFMPITERQICKHPLVSRAMMFGREQFHPGVIIEPVEGNRLDPSNKSAVEHFIDKIWYLNSPLMLLDLRVSLC